MILYGNLFWGKCNSSLDLHSADFGIFGDFADFSPVSAPKIPKNHESQTENPSVVDSALAQNLNENNPRVSANLESRPLRGAKNRNQASSSASADFLLEAEKRGSPPKSEKRQLLARRGSGAGGAALLREESSENGGEGSAESSKDYVDSQNLKNGLLRSPALARNDGNSRK